MDFPHNTPKHPYSSDDSLAIHQRFSVDWDKFRNTLIRKKLPQNTHRWYTLRAERFLTYLVRNNISEISDLHVRNYLQAAVSDRRLQDWQARQVVDAIRILCVDVLGGEGFDMVPWDDLLRLNRDTHHFLLHRAGARRSRLNRTPTTSPHHSIHRAGARRSRLKRTPTTSFISSSWSSTLPA